MVVDLLTHLTIMAIEFIGRKLEKVLKGQILVFNSNELELELGKKKKKKKKKKEEELEEEGERDNILAGKNVKEKWEMVFSCL